MLLVKQLFTDFFNLLFPELCSACAVQLFHGERFICTRCTYDLPFTDFHLYAENPVAKLFWGRIPCRAAMAMLYFRKGTKVQNLIHQLKYKGQTDLGFELGRMLGEKLLSAADYIKADLIIPIPLHPRKLRSRGYNQSKTIADGMASVLQLPVNTTQLIRKVPTTTQTKKTRFERSENMKAVFIVLEPDKLKDKHIILVDDVITTGATLESCGQVLLDCGISKLSITALAYAE